MNRGSSQDLSIPHHPKNITAQLFASIKSEVVRIFFEDYQWKSGIPVWNLILRTTGRSPQEARVEDAENLVKR
jgi:hypothetical protein